jgi:hypothetical protein
MLMSIFVLQLVSTDVFSQRLTTDKLMAMMCSAWMCVQGLEFCADTFVGDEMVRGISGGQASNSADDSRHDPFLAAAEPSLTSLRDAAVCRCASLMTLQAVDMQKKRLTSAEHLVG